MFVATAITNDNSQQLAKWGIAFAVSLGALMEIVDSTIVNVALSQLQASFSSTLQQISWVVSSYAVANVIVCAKELQSSSPSLNPERVHRVNRPRLSETRSSPSKCRLGGQGLLHSFRLPCLWCPIAA